jgi:hypothetical protein
LLEPALTADELDGGCRMAPPELVGEGERGKEMASGASSSDDDLVNVALLINWNAVRR